MLHSRTGGEIIELLRKHYASWLCLKCFEGWTAGSWAAGRLNCRKAELQDGWVTPLSEKQS